MLQQPWATVPLSVTVRRKAVGTCDENTRAHAAPAGGPSSRIGTRRLYLPRVPVAPEMEARAETGRCLGLTGWPF